jgi:hypothetical protein
MRHRVMSLTTDRVCMGTRQAVSLHQWNTTKDETWMIEICVMKSAVEIHAAGSKIDVRSASALNSSSVKKGTITTMVHIMKGA